LLYQSLGYAAFNASENRESTKNCTGTAKNAYRQQVQQKRRGFRRKTVPAATELSPQKTISALTVEPPRKDKIVICFDNPSVMRL